LLVIVLVLLATPALAQNVPAFEVTALPELPGSTSTARGIRFSAPDEDIGPLVVSGSASDAMGVMRAVVWQVDSGQTGLPLILPPLSPMMDSWANTIAWDSAGTTAYVAGASIDPLGMKRPVYWSKASAESAYGPPMTLPTLGGNEGEAVAFQGQPVDFSGTEASFLVGTSTTMGGVEKPVVWKVIGPGLFTITPLPDYGPDAAGRALGFDYDGIGRFACGWSVDAQGDTIPQVWRSDDDGAMWTGTALPLLPGGSVGLGSDAICGDNRVFVVGWSEIGGGNRHAVFWDSLDSGQSWSVVDLPPANGLPNSEGYVGGIAGDLVVGGRSYGAPGTAIATLWIDNGMTLVPHDLSTLTVNIIIYDERDLLGMDTRPDGSLGICGIGTDITSDPGRSAIGPHAFMAEQVGGTDVNMLMDTDPLELAAFPNPFSRATVLAFALHSPSRVRVSVHDIAGRQVVVLEDGERAAGRHSVSWNGRDQDELAVSPGVYFVRLEAAGETAIANVVRLR